MPGLPDVELGDGVALAEPLSPDDESTGAALPARAGLASGSGGETSRRNPSRSAFRRARSACASSIEDEWLLTPIPKEIQRSSDSLFVRPSSRASS